MTDTVLITAATEREMECFGKVPLSHLNLKIFSIISGIGPVSTVYAIMNYLSQNSIPDLILNIGIAGSYTENLPIGRVVVPETDLFADLGICSGKEFIPLSRTGIKDDDDNITPVGNYNASREVVVRLKEKLAVVKAVTVSTATGTSEAREAILKEYEPDIETMEGAAVYYVCNKKGIPCIGIRSVSNMAGERDKSSWDINLAFEQLGKALVEYFNDIVR